MLNLIVGFILGVMALWIYLALAAKRRAPPPTKAKRRHQPLKPGQVHGPYGGQPYTPPPMPPRKTVQPNAPTIQPAPDLYRCIDCGSMVKRDETSWGHCGACQEKAARNAYLTNLAKTCGNHTFDRGMREEFWGKTVQPNAQGENLQPLGAEFEKVLHENLWDLYETGEPGVKYEWINVAGERE